MSRAYDGSPTQPHRHPKGPTMIPYRTAIATLLVILAILAATFIVALGATEPANSEANCKVLSLNVTIEDKTRPGATEPEFFRWVRAERVRCHGVTVRMVTRGEWVKGLEALDR